MANTNSTNNSTKNNTPPSLDEALEAWTVHDPTAEPAFDSSGNINNIHEAWFGVSSDDAGGIYAYFANEVDAYRFRLAEVNRAVNV